METWTDLCRCCLSAQTEVSLFDKEQNNIQKFQEITTIEVKPDDGLPQKLCEDCNSILSAAYLFRKQCLKMDSELKTQLNSLLSQCNQNIDEIEKTHAETDEIQDVEFANNPMKQLEAIIKQEPMDSDDDYYYVLVIDNPKDKDNVEETVSVNLKQEEIKKEVENTIEIDESEDYSQSEEQGAEYTENYDNNNQNNEFVNTVESFLVTNSVPANVPATILEDEEYQDDIDMNNDTQDSNSQEISETDNNNIIEGITDEQNLIKILTSNSEDGTILLKSSDGIIYHQLTDGQLASNDEESQEVILCEGDESNFQILKYDGSELVIEYADESQIDQILQEGQSYLCDCGEQFTDMEEYKKHQIQHNPAGEHLCTMCGKGFESAEILTGHMVLHNVSGSVLNCPFCNQAMKRNVLTQHIKFSHNNIKPQCEICKKTFANPNNLKRHMMIHTGVKEFKCDICFKQFHQKITMQTHRLIHMNPLVCPDCETVFKTKSEFTAHCESNECPKVDPKAKEEIMKTVKKEVMTSQGKLLGYACSLCKKMFSIESALEEHIETTHIVHTTDVLCSECGVVLGSKKEMQLHVLSHVKPKVKRFECPTCGKGCPSQAMLTMHERVHTNERPYACQLCPLKFKTKTHLGTHQLTHTREKKFGCSICMKYFALKGNLVVHLRTHTGERPYVCSICNEAFIDSKYLKKHKVKKHAIENVPWNQYLQMTDT